MLYGYFDTKGKTFRKYTRVSTHATIVKPENLSIGDNVWIGHFTVLDASQGLQIDDGVQIAGWSGVLTHGSQDAIRLLGPRFVHIPHTERGGYKRGSVHIGRYTFLGAGTIVLPGVNIGKGCLIGACSLVTHDIPDFSIARGQPAKVVGSTIDIDAKHFLEEDFSETYYDKEALEKVIEKVMELKLQNKKER